MKNWFYNESLLIYLWQLRKYDPKKLTTTTGDAIVIQDPGVGNSDAGPDFSNARVIIGDITWYGMVEMHWFSSNWYLHNHQEDGAYNNVILHVVYEEDRIVYNGNGERIPCVELKDQIPKEMEDKFSQFHLGHWIPCQALLPNVSTLTSTMWLERLTIERLETKANRIILQLQETNWNWEEVCYRQLAKYFGSSINNLPFEKLAYITPHSILLKHQEDPIALEALLLGQAGFLHDETKDDHTAKLKREYEFLRKKFKLQAMEKFEWKFLRLRPQNFPTVRIAQLAALLHHHGTIFRKIIDCQNIKDLFALLTATPSEYWETHYQVGVPSKPIGKTLGKGEIKTLIINSIIPLVFLYGKYKKEDIYQQLALEWLYSLPPENNKILREWTKLGLPCTNSAQSQALLQLYLQYCSPKKCLNCGIGNAIINQRRP